MFLLWQLIGPALLAGLLAMVAMMPVSYLTAYAARSLLGIWVAFSQECQR